MERKSFYVVALATLGLTATGCQKESTEYLPFQSAECISAYTMEYSIDGETHRAMFQTKDEYNAMILRLMSLAREGYEVKVRNGNIPLREASSKEVVVYTTSDENDAAKWTSSMTAAGYSVTVTYDEQKGLYTCIAVM